MQSFRSGTIYVTNNSAGNVTLNSNIWPATSPHGGGVADSVTGSGSAVISGAQWNLGTTPMPYCRTGYGEVTPVTAWSENPALMMRHIYQHPAFGKAAITASEDERFCEAADACDRAQTCTVARVPTATTLFRAAVVIPYGSDANSAFDDLAQAMTGSWALLHKIITRLMKLLNRRGVLVQEQEGPPTWPTAMPTRTRRERSGCYRRLRVPIALPSARAPDRRCSRCKAPCHLSGVGLNEGGRPESVPRGFARIFALPRAAPETTDAGRLARPWRSVFLENEDWGRAPGRSSRLRHWAQDDARGPLRCARAARCAQGCAR